MNPSFCVHSSCVHRTGRGAKGFVLLAIFAQRMLKPGDHDFANGAKKNAAVFRPPRRW
jgi:hypothetical protein